MRTGRPTSEHSTYSRVKALVERAITHELVDGKVIQPTFTIEGTTRAIGTSYTMTRMALNRLTTEGVLTKRSISTGGTFIALYARVAREPVTV